MPSVSPCVGRTPADWIMEWESDASESSATWAWARSVSAGSLNPR
jgi:hypothetical protein